MILKGNMTHQIVFHQLQGVASFEQSSLNLFLNMVYLKENSYFLCQRELKDRGNIYTILIQKYQKRSEFILK